MVDATLGQIALALYAGAPDAFIATRDARATQIDDPALAARVLALRKPSIAAWVVNVFAQERAAQLGEALRLAGELREAQADLDAPALVKLGRERRALTRRLAETAADVARARGERVTSATLEAVERSISAAFFDQEAAGAVASGRLMRTLDPSSTSSDIREAVAGGVAELEPVPPAPPDELQARRVRRDAERTLAAAVKERAAAERELEKRDAEVRGLQDAVSELADRVGELEAELDRTRAKAIAAGEAVSPATQRREEAAARAKAAATDAERAQRALEAL